MDIISIICVYSLGLLSGCCLTTEVIRATLRIELATKYGKDFEEVYKK